jgi:hypothetical protein
LHPDASMAFNYKHHAVLFTNSNQRGMHCCARQISIMDISAEKNQAARMHFDVQIFHKQIGPNTRSCMAIETPRLPPAPPVVTHHVNCERQKKGMGREMCRERPDFTGREVCRERHAFTKQDICREIPGREVCTGRHEFTGQKLCTGGPQSLQSPPVLMDSVRLSSGS